jgi:hypothetical protein
LNVGGQTVHEQQHDARRTSTKPIFDGINIENSMIDPSDRRRIPWSAYQIRAWNGWKAAGHANNAQLAGAEHLCAIILSKVRQTRKREILARRATVGKHMTSAGRAPGRTVDAGGAVMRV